MRDRKQIREAIEGAELVRAPVFKFCHAATTGDEGEPYCCTRPERHPGPHWMDVPDGGVICEWTDATTTPDSRPSSKPAPLPAEVTPRDDLRERAIRVVAEIDEHPIDRVRATSEWPSSATGSAVAAVERALREVDAAAERRGREAVLTRDIAALDERDAKRVDCEHDRAIIQGGAILWCIECGAIQPWNNGPAGKWQRPSLAAAVKP